jgi:hypothetical protein
VQQLSPASTPQLVIPGPPTAQLGGSTVVVPAQAPAEQVPVAQGQGFPHTHVEVQVST